MYYVHGITIKHYFDCFHGALTWDGRKNPVFPEVADLKVSVESNFRGAPRIRPPMLPSLASGSRKSACSTTPENWEEIQGFFDF